MTAWRLEPLRSLGTWYGGGTPSKSRPEFWQGGSVPWLSPKDMGESVLTGTKDHITDAAIAGSATRLVAPDSVAVVVRSGILERTLPVAVVPFATTLNQDMKALTCRPGVDPRWVAWGIRANERALLRAARKAGTTVASLEWGRFLDWRLPIPPLVEQQRMVEILEDHLSRLDVGAVGLASAAARVEQLRRAQMAEALLGDAWRDLARVDAGSLGGPTEPRLTLPAGWTWRKWKDIGTSRNGRAFPSGDYTDTGVRLLRPGNLGADGLLAWRPESTRRLPSEYAREHPGLLLGPGDIVMNLTAQSLKDDFLGRVCLLQPGDESLLNQRIACLRTGQADSEYVFLVFRSPLFRRYVRSLNTGSLIQHMFTKQVDEFWLPLPAEPVQRRLASEAAAHRAIEGRLVDAAEVARRRTHALRRALLAAAFSGTPTGRTPELGRAEEKVLAQAAPGTSQGFRPADEPTA